MVIRNEAGAVSTALTAAQAMSTISRRFFIADQNYYSFLPVPQSRVFTGGTERRMVLYKGQIFSDTKFKNVFGDVPEDAVRAPTPAEVQSAVNAYLTLNPVQGAKGDQGDPGTPATDEEVQAFVDAYMEANPVEPPAAIAPTTQQIATAVQTYLVANPPAKGDKGDAGSKGVTGDQGVPGRAPTSAEIASAVSTYLVANAASFKGDQGIQGNQGVQGVPGTPADMTRVTALETAMTAVNLALTKLNGMVVGRGSGTLTNNLIVAAIGNATITWDTGFQPPDTNYFVIAVQDSGTAAIIQVTGPATSKATASCAVPVKNIGSLAAGSGYVFRAIAVKSS